jgi:outer membrane protein assembly factor BamB
MKRLGTLASSAVLSASAVVSGGALSLGVVACDGLQSVANPEAPLWVHHPGSAMAVTARRELTAPSRRAGEPWERGRPELDPSHRRVFVGSSDRGLYALDAVDLSTLWRFETANAVQSEPLYDPVDDAVYFGSNDGALYKLRAADGKLLWRFASNAEITRRPVLHTPPTGERALLMVNANDTLVSIDPKSGELNWYRHRQPAAGMEISGYAGPAVLEDLVFAAFSDGVVMAFRVDDGAEAWLSPVDLAADAEQGEELRYLDVDTTPVVTRVGDTDAIVVASYEGGLYALDALSGGQLWANDAVLGATELTLFEGPAKARRGEADAKEEGAASDRVHRVLVASSGLTGLWGVALKDGAEMWRRDLPTGGVTAAVPCAGALLVGTTRYGLFLFHPLDGGVLDGVYAGGAFAASPAAYARRAFALTNEGTLLSLHIEPP